MANAGIMNKNNHGESVKKLCKLAVPISRILKSFSKKNKNKAEIKENAPMIIHALQFPK
jgi:transcriptional antiterminator